MLLNCFYIAIKKAILINCSIEFTEISLKQFMTTSQVSKVISNTYTLN